MQELAGLTFQYDTYSEVMGMLWKRMVIDFISSHSYGMVSSHGLSHVNP